MKQRDTGISRAGLEGVGTGSLLLERGLSLWESGEQPVRGERSRDRDSSLTNPREHLGVPAAWLLHWAQKISQETIWRRN